MLTILYSFYLSSTFLDSKKTNSVVRVLVKSVLRTLLFPCIWNFSQDKPLLSLNHPLFLLVCSQLKAITADMVSVLTVLRAQFCCGLLHILKYLEVLDESSKLWKMCLLMTIQNLLIILSYTIALYCLLPVFKDIWDHFAQTNHHELFLLILPPLCRSAVSGIL